MDLNYVYGSLVFVRAGFFLGYALARSFYFEKLSLGHLSIFFENLYLGALYRS
jgi:hypothetical protein